MYNSNTLRIKREYRETCPWAIYWNNDMQTSLPIYDMKACNEFLNGPIKNKYVQ
jgi:hypothetical protein